MGRSGHSQDRGYTRGKMQFSKSSMGVVIFIISVSLCNTGCKKRVQNDGSAGESGSTTVPSWADSSNGAMGVPPIPPRNPQN